MISSLRGSIVAKELDHVVVDVGGVGYHVNVSVRTLSDLSPLGSETQLLCYTHVREDAIQLFGFASAGERMAFTALIGVSGVGPKLALTILSGLPLEDLVGAISTADHRRLCAIPGVGRKTAERLVVDLKDNFKRVVGSSNTTAASSAGHDATADVVTALVNLGYKRTLAQKAVDAVAAMDSDLNPEQLLRRALSRISEL